MTHGKIHNIIECLSKKENQNFNYNCCTVYHHGKSLSRWYSVMNEFQSMWIDNRNMSLKISCKSSLKIQKRHLKPYLLPVHMNLSTMKFVL